MGIVPEIGGGRADGARRRDVLVHILRQHLRPALIGVALGLAGAPGLARFLESLVYSVGATDPLTLLAMGLTPHGRGGGLL
ncbi:MAG: hypothetical protein ACSLFE_10715, partial [Gemmatimonadaceae bacterium]